MIGNGMPKAPTSKTQSQKQDDVVAYAQRLKEYGIKGMEHHGILRRRERSIQYRMGKHKIKLRPDRYGNQVWNKFGAIGHERVAHVHAKKPKWRFSPRQEGAIYSADALNDIVGGVLWDIIEWEDKGEISLNEAWNAGSSHVKAFVRSDGYPDAIAVSANQIIIDPDARSEKDRKFWIHVYPMDVSEIQDEWNVKVRAETIVEDLNTGLVQKSFEAAGDDLAPINIFKDGDTQWTSQAVGRALVYELWSGDSTLEPIPFKDEEIVEEHLAFRGFQPVTVEPGEHHPKHIKAHEVYLATLDPELDATQIGTIVQHMSEHQSYPQKEKRKKYPYGRKTMTCQGKFLEDGPNPYAKVMQNPIGWNDLLLKYNWDTVDDSYWGKPGGHDLYDPQDAINHRKNAITQMINRMNHGIKTMLTRSFESLRGSFKKLNNLIGTVIPVKNHDDFKIDFGPPFPPQIFQDEYHSEEFMDKVSHQTDILSGNLPKGSPPGVVVNQLTGLGMVSIDMVVTHYARMLQRLGRIIQHLAIEFIPPEKKFRMMDTEKNFQFVPWEELKQEMGKFDLHIDVDSMLSTNRQEKLDTSIRLFDAKLFDRRAAFDYMDIPNKYETLQRIDEILQLEAENAQLKQGLSTVMNENDRLAQNIRAMSEKPQGKDG